MRFALYICRGGKMPSNSEAFSSDLDYLQQTACQKVGEQLHWIYADLSWSGFNSDGRYRAEIRSF